MMLFAEWTSTEVGGVMVGITGLATAIGAIGKSWLENRHKYKMEEKMVELKESETKNKERMDEIEATIRHWANIASWQKKELEKQKAEIGRREAQVLEVQEALIDCNKEHALARQEVAEMYYHIERQHDFSVRVAAICRDLQKDPGPVPEKPIRPSRLDSSNIEFKLRTVDQNAKLITEVNKQSEEKKS